VRAAFYERLSPARVASTDVVESVMLTVIASLALLGYVILRGRWVARRHGTRR
jgi:hypothetical protein